MQECLETEGLGVVFLFACSRLLGNTQCNGSGCGSCLLNGKGWRAVVADGGSLVEQLQHPQDGGECRGGKFSR